MKPPLPAILKEKYSFTPPRHWSFAEEWKYHKETGQILTWDWDPAERLRQFFEHTKTSRESIAGKLVLDAGCGNGLLTEAIGTAGAFAVGIDIHPHLPEFSESAFFLQADFDHPPFNPYSFDIVIAIGSIHHTPDTYRSFLSLAQLVKPGGRLYVWVYKKQKGKRRVLLFLLDIMRVVISRSPAWLQRISVRALTQFFYILSRIRKGQNSKRTKQEIRVNIFDAFTPRYRFYHSEQEIRDWFSNLGFTGISVTNPDNGYGFGMLGYN